MRKSFGRVWHALSYEHARFVYRTLSLGPPLVGSAVAALFAWPPQMMELYLGAFEEGSPIEFVRGGLALCCLALLCELLYYWHLFLSTPRIGEVYQKYPNLHFDRTLIKVRNVKALCCAFLPIIGILTGLVFAYVLEDKTCNHLSNALKILLPHSPGSGTAVLGPDCAPLWFGVRVASLKLAAVALLVIACGCFLWRALPRLENSTTARRLIASTGALLAILAVLGPLFAPIRSTVDLTWLAGSVLIVLVVTTSAVAILMSLSWLSQQIKFPIISALLVFGIVIAARGINGNVSLPPEPIAAVNPGEKIEPAFRDEKAKLEATFSRWLGLRRPGEKLPYPVFIIAAEGGGIYAASAAGLFLAELQDRCPQFAEHIFAISAVSGGAVGVAAFHGLLDDVAFPANGNAPSKACASALNRTFATANRVEKILRADHLAPVASLVLPDLLRKFGLARFGRAWDRAGALQLSVLCAFEDERVIGSVHSQCGSKLGELNRLSEPFVEHWGNGRRPALILNTTWVETGFRVAFSPFPLKRGIGDGTLYAFSELPGANISQISLLEAAVASARFPLISSAWNLPHTGGRSWNFVDGGYADNSGSTSALEIYKALAETAAKQNADLHLIVLTDALAAPEPGDINGSGFSDTVAPLTALLNVRGQLSSRAVTQAIDYSKSSDEERVGRGENSKLLVAKLDQRSVALPLGWTISRTELDFIKLMLGRTEFCRPAPANPVAADVTTSTIVDNSCIKQKIVDLLSR